LAIHDSFAQLDILGLAVLVIIATTLSSPITALLD
jgi:hypothetical protein